MSETESKRPRWAVLTLSLMPLWLGLSAGGAVWWSLRSDKQAEEERDQRFAMEMSVERIADDLRKLEEVIGPRGIDYVENLNRAASMLEGILGPSNTGYRIQKIPSPLGAPILVAELKGSSDHDQSLWVIAPYDSPPGKSDASAPAALVAVAQAMARDQLPVDIRFILLPYGHNPHAAATWLGPLNDDLPDAAMIFCLDTMRHPSGLAVAAPELADVIDRSAERAAGIDVEDTPREPMDLSPLSDSGFFTDDVPASLVAAELLEGHWPVIRVGSLNKSGQGEAPDAANVAINSGKLVEWLRRAARLEAAR